MLFPTHARQLTALPRVLLNGDFQSLACTALFSPGRLSCSSRPTPLSRTGRQGRAVQRSKSPAGNTQARPATTK